MMSGENLKRLQLEVEMMPDEGVQFPECQEAIQPCLDLIYDYLIGIDKRATLLPELRQVNAVISAENARALYQRLADIRHEIDEQVSDHLRRRFGRGDGVHAVCHTWEHAYMIG